eukprot:227801_1
MSLTKRVVSKLAGSTRNVIHSKDGALKLGYKDALVGGVGAFSYGYSLIMDAYTQNFVKNGYIKLKFIRPMYPERDIKISLNKMENGNFSMNFMDEITNKIYIESNGYNHVNNDIIKDHYFKQYIDKRIDDNEYNKFINEQLVNTPLNKNTSSILCGNYLKIYPYTLTENEAKDFSLNIARDNNYKLIHIGILLNFMNRIIDETFPYYPVIHTSSEIQFVNENNVHNMKTNQTFKSYGKIIEIWKRKDNYYTMVHGLVTDQLNNCIAVIKHTTIYDFGVKSKL